MQVERDIPEILKGKIKGLDLLTHISSKKDDEVAVGCRVETDLGLINIVDTEDQALLFDELSLTKSDFDDEKSEFEVLEEGIGLIISDKSPIGQALVGGHAGETREFISGDGRRCSIGIGEKIEVSPLLLLRE